MWDIEPADLYERKIRSFQRRHGAILNALHQNAEKYHQALSAGVAPMQIKGGFIHPENYHGLVTVDTSGAPTKQRAARLYLYPDTTEKVLHFITIGFKDTQSEDIKMAKQYVDQVRGGENHG